MIITPRFAGTFYPADKTDLNDIIDGFLGQVKDVPYIPKSIIVPHAGYFYSGKIAATAYKALMKNKNIKNVVIFAPSHYKYFYGVAVTSAHYFETPLGMIEVNREVVEKLRRKFDFIIKMDEVFRKEHSLEVQIPFIQKTFPNVRIIPIIIGECPSDYFTELIAYLWDQKDVFVISSDMSHFLSQEEQKTIDEQTIHHIEKLDYEKLRSEGLCGYRPVKGMVKFARDNGLKIINVDSGNSGDTTGDKSSVVGYASFVVV